MDTNEDGSVNFDAIEDANALAAFAEKLTEKPSTLKAVIAVLRDILNKLKGLVAGAEAQRLANMLSKFEELYRASASRTTEGQAQNEARHSISATELAEIEAERKSIIETAKANGTYLKAPNGKDTNLTPKQWVEVRTKRFKAWFGDWEKAARIEKLRKSENVSISGNEIVPSGDMKEYRKNALEYGKTIRGEYVNTDTGSLIVINKDSLTEVLHHDGSNIAHIQSIAAIPQMVESGIYITSEPISETASKKLRNAKKAHYYVCGLNIGDVPYTVKFVVAEFESGEKYYDHSLTEIEKGELLNRAELSSTVAESKTPISDIKDKRLISILQTNSSKIVDANGEPKVVYHQTNATVYINRETGQNWDELDWRERMEWDERDDWDDYWEEREFNTFSRVNARTTQELDGFFFAPEYDEYHEYGNRTIEAFLNIENPASFGDYNIDSSKTNAGRDERIRLQNEGYDGVINEEDGSIWEYIAFNPNQIKSAKENIGTYDANNPDIRYSLRELDAPYLDAVERGDMETAQRMVLEAAKLAMPNTWVADVNGNPRVMYHGDRKRARYIFSTDTFFTPNAEYARRYINGTGEVYATYLNIEKPFDIRDKRAYDIFTEFRGGRKPVETNSGAMDWAEYSYEDLQEYVEDVAPNRYDGFILDEGADPDGKGGVVHRGLSYVPFSPNQIKSADPVTYDDNGDVIPLSERFNPEKEDIRYSLSSQPIFYSNAEYAVRGIKQEKATPEQWLKMIEKNGGLKAGEDKWLGLSDWLKASDKKTITKDEVLQYIAENDIQIEEVEYAQFGPGLIDEATRKLEAEMREIGIEAMREKYDGFDDLFEVYNGELLWSEERASEGEYEDFIIENNIVDVNAQANAINETRLGYTTNGLDNKREIALTVPTIEPWNTSDNIHFGDAGEGRAVAWIRFGETTDADGKRVLVIDEIQSKRHQEGREKGYSDKRVSQQELYDAQEEAFSKVIDYESALADKYGEDEWASLASEEEMAEYERLRAIDEAATNAYENYDKGIPSAPFEKNWAELAMKRMLRYAAENGYDYVAWTTGDQQADRYNIGSVVSRIVSYTEGDVTNVSIKLLNNEALNLLVDADGKVVKSNRDTGAETLADVVGKELATKVLNNEGEDVTIWDGKDIPAKQISGDGLRIGGEGMKAFYDQMLPSFVRKYAKKWGATVGEVTMPDLEKNNTMHSVDVTPAMRESVMQGQPKFSLQEVNDRFNKELATLTEENARERILNVGTPSPILLACGIEDKPIRLYGAKLLSKVRKHGYKIDVLKNLPLAISSPIAVFEGSKKNSFAILTELRIGNNNVLAALSVGKGGHDVDFNIISSVYDKREDSVARWVNDGKMLWVDKKKALDYFSVSAPLAEAQNNQELISTTKVIQNFENPKIEPKKSLHVRRFSMPMPDDIFFDDNGDIISFSGDDVREATTIVRRTPKTTEERIKMYMESRHLAMMQRIRKDADDEIRLIRQRYNEEREKRTVALGNMRGASAKIDYILGDTPREALPLYDQALILLAEGEVKIRWEDDGTLKGLASELGYKKGEKARMRNITGGATLSFEAFVHQWWQNGGSPRDSRQYRISNYYFTIANKKPRQPYSYRDHLIKS